MESVSKKTSTRFSLFLKVLEWVVGLAMLIRAFYPIIQSPQVFLQNWYMSLLSAAQIIVFIIFLVSYRRPVVEKIGWKVVIGLIAITAGISFFDVRDVGPPELVETRIAAISIYALFGVWSFTVLGRSFGIFPGLRSIVVAGPYQFVRHPIYATYLHIECILIMTLTMSAQNLLALTMVYAGTILRLDAEEKVLMIDERYQEFIQHTPRKLWHPILSAPLMCYLLFYVYYTWFH